MVEPAVSAVADEYQGRIKVGKLDVYANMDAAMAHNVRGLPTLLLFKGGAVKEQMVGAVAKNAIQRAIEKHL